MNRTGCQHEFELLKAQRTGALPLELQAHVESCAACAESLQIAQVLAASAQRAQLHHRMPGAGQVWFKAQRRARQAAILRATRSMRVMQLLGGLYALALAGWATRWLVAGQLQSLTPAFRNAGGGFAVLGSLAAVASMALGMLIFAGDGRPKRGLGR